jgi:hypothetical protein
MKMGTPKKEDEEEKKKKQKKKRRKGRAEEMKDNYLSATYKMVQI